MLIVDNGAYKSGSSWLYNILKVVTGESNPLNDYQDPDWIHPSLDKDKLQNFLDEGDYRNRHYLVKQHFRDTELKQFVPYLDGDILFVDIERDIRDVIVSAYYHKQRKGYDSDFNNYYWSNGRFLYERIRSYHENIRTIIPPVYLHTVSYELLLTSFSDELEKLCVFLKKTLDKSLLDKAENETAFKSMKKQSENNAFFRKGISGDFDNHFDWLMRQDYRENTGQAIINIIPYYLFVKERFVGEKK